MNNPDDTKNTGPTVTPTDKGEDSEDRRDAAQKVWRDKSQPQRENDDSVEPPQKRAPEVDDVDDIDEKR